MVVALEAPVATSASAIVIVTSFIRTSPNLAHQLHGIP
jgi:hypothetical protein